VEAWSGKNKLENTTGRKRTVGLGLNGLIAQDKTPLLIPTVSAAVLQERLGSTLDIASLAQTAKSGIQSFLGIPLLIGERLIGTLTLVHCEADHFTEDNRRQLSRLAAQASIAIDNAIRVRQRESALKEQIRELQIEIDEVKKTRQVQEIVETEYFQKLREQAKQMRAQAKRQS
jgi:GAF domain-containing protein